MKGEHINKALWYYNGSVDMTSKDYLPYLVLALFMLLTFNILPLLLLALYPFKSFQRFLGHCLAPSHLILALVAKFQPYKCKSSNTASVLSWDVLFPKWSKELISFTYIVVLIIQCYFLFLILASVTLKVAQCFKPTHNHINGEENMEDQALWRHGEADYGSCH